MAHQSRESSDVFFLNLVLRAKRSCFPSPQNPIMFNRLQGTGECSIFDEQLVGTRGGTRNWSTLWERTCFCWRKFDVWNSLMLHSLLQSWFWSGLNRYLNTQPNRVFGALGILKMTPYFGKGRSSYKPSFCSVSRWCFNGVLILNRIFGRRIGVFHPLILSQCNSPNFNFGDFKKTLPETNIARENPIFPGKYHQNGGFPMAMLVYRRKIKHVKVLFHDPRHGRVRHPVLTLTKHSEDVSRVLETGWWFHFFFQPNLGKIPILTNIFQMGWNHQLGNLSIA